MLYTKIYDPWTDERVTNIYRFRDGKSVLEDDLDYFLQKRYKSLPEGEVVEDWGGVIHDGGYFYLLDGLFVQEDELDEYLDEIKEEIVTARY